MYLDLAALFGDRIADGLRAHAPWWDSDDDEDEEEEEDSGDSGGGDDGGGGGDDDWSDDGGDDWSDDDGGSSVGDDDSGGDWWDINDDTSSSGGDDGGGSDWWDDPGDPVWSTATTVANSIGRARTSLGGDSWDDWSPETFMASAHEEDRPSRARRSRFGAEPEPEERGILREILNDTGGQPSRADEQQAVRDLIPPEDLRARALAARERAVTPSEGGIVANIIAAAQDMLQRAAEDPEGKKAIQTLALEDWQRESGRRMPNPNDPRDMANFKRYVEDWVGRAKDFDDSASGMGAIERVRKQVVGLAQKTAAEEAQRRAQQAPVAGPQPQPQAPSATAQSRPGARPPNMVSDGSETTSIGMASATTAAGRDRYFDERIQQRGPGAQGDVSMPPTAQPEMRFYPESMSPGQDPMSRGWDPRPASHSADSRQYYPESVNPGEHPISRGTTAAPPTKPGSQVLYSDGINAVPAGPRLDELHLGPSPSEVTANGPSYDLSRLPESLGSGLVSQAIGAGMKPLDAAVQVLLAQQQKSGTPVAPGADQQAARHLASAISAGESWAQPALETVAQMAWYRESRGMEGAPEAAPASYVQDWINTWRSGGDVPGAGELNRQLREQGVWSPDTPFQPGWIGLYGGKQGQLAIDQSKLITDPNYRKLMNTQISVAEAKAFCGPIAAIALARVVGRDPTVDEVRRMAIEVGWTPGAGMGGIQNHKRLLDRMGVPAEIGVADTVRIAKEVTEGRPVVISTGAHYYLATDYNPENGKFFVGATGRALPVRPSDWMSLAEIERQSLDYDSRNGGINGAMYLGMRPEDAPGLAKAPAAPVAPAAPASPAASPPQAAQPGTGPVSLPPQLASAQPVEGLIAGRSSPADQIARVYQRSLVETGDADFAEGMAALVVGEGGLGGAVGDTGQSYGPFQFYWGGGEGNLFQKWLGEQRGRPVSLAEAREAAKNVDTALDYYTQRAYGFYQKGRQRGLTNPTLAIVGGGHNSGAIGGREQKIYEDAWRRWKAGQFTGGQTIQSISQ